MIQGTCSLSGVEAVEGVVSLGSMTCFSVFNKFKGKK